MPHHNCAVCPQVLQNVQSMFITAAERVGPKWRFKRDICNLLFRGMSPLELHYAARELTGDQVAPGTLREYVKRGHDPFAGALGSNQRPSKKKIITDLEIAVTKEVLQACVLR